jgi:hypothetical protein
MVILAIFVSFRSSLDALGKEKYFAHSGMERFLRHPVYSGITELPILSHMDQFRTLTRCLMKIYFKIILPSTGESSKRYLSYKAKH